jgi:hypothetical protein
MSFDGIRMHLGNLPLLSDAETRWVTAENVFGEKGAGAMAEVSDTPQPEVEKLGQEWHKLEAARDLGRGYKVRPYTRISPGRTAPLMDLAGPGAIQHFWLTTDAKRLRDLILRMYWDGEETPSVETPLGDFFCNGWDSRVDVCAVPISVNPTAGFNCYLPMPFRTRARVTLENRSPGDEATVYYCLACALADPGADAAYLHATFRRSNPLTPGEPHVILDGVRGRGQYVGAYLTWQQNASGWWGEGEVKMYLDGDEAFPTIVGTGTEDYFGGAWGFRRNFCAPFAGYPEGSSDDRPGNRHGLYRFHVLDPVRFREDIRVTMDAIGWRSEGRYLPLADDIASVAWWYQREPHKPLPQLGDRDALQVT